MAREGKPLEGKNQTRVRGTFMYVDSFTITINKRKSLVRVETIYYVSLSSYSLSSKNGVTLLILIRSDLLPRSTLIVPFV